MTLLTNSLTRILLVLGTLSGSHLAAAWSTLTCNEIASKSAILRLRKYLFCDYDQGIRPTSNYNNATLIRFSILPQTFEVYEETSTIDLHAWTSLSWNDVHLTWDPSQYEDLKWIHVKNYEIWVPDVVAHIAGGGNDEIPFTSCWLYHEGDIYCVPPTVYKIHCDADHTWWPYGMMDCIAQFGSWSHSVEEFRVHFGYNEVEGLLATSKSEQNQAWEILRTYMTELTKTSKYGEEYKTKLVSYHMILRRYASFYAASYVVPAVVLMIMTLLTLWLEPKSIERMTIANLNFLCHLLCIWNLFWRIPLTGNNRPKIINFYETSLVLSALSLILTSILRHIQELTVQAPVWISSSTAAFLRSKVGQILLISILDPKVSAEIEADADDNTDLVSSTKKEVTWQYVTIIIGWIAFLAVLIAYFVILALYLPTSNSINSSFVNSTTFAS